MIDPMLTTNRILSKLGGGEDKTVIRWNGNTDGLTCIEPFGFPLYRVSDKLIPPGEVQITLFSGLTMSGVLSELLPGFVASNEGIVISVKAGEYGEGEEAISIPESGTYFAYIDGHSMNIASISFEAIHPIDPKYIPWDSAPGGGSGGGLPVVEFTTQLETGVTLTDAENAALHEAFNAGTPLVIDAQAKCGTSLLRFMTVINPLTGGSYDYFAARVTNDQGDFNLYFKSLYGGTWSVTVEALGTLPIVNDCPINLIVGTYTLDATNSDKVRAAYNMNLPIVIKGYCNAGEDDDFNPIEFKYAILFQVDLMNGKLLGQYGDKRITISNLKDYGNCSYTVATA